MPGTKFISLDVTLKVSENRTNKQKKSSESPGPMFILGTTICTVALFDSLLSRVFPETHEIYLTN